MKLYSPDKSLLMDVAAIKEHPEGIVLEGRIMGAMPMKAVLRPEELRAALRLISAKLVIRAMIMLLRGRKAPARVKS